MRVTEYELEYCRDRASIITAILPNNHIGTPRVELSDGGLGILCQVFIGETEVEQFLVPRYEVVQ